jgi:arylsulfatase A-like enzyme
MDGKSNQPNIIYIMSDDHGAHAISSYGSKINSTPNIDRLAQEGIRFSNCFDVNSVCAPSRASILAGKHSSANGFFRNGDTFDGSQETFPKILKRAGYETAIIGKWHLVSEPTGFDYYNVLPGQGRYWDPVMKEKGKPWQDGPNGGEVRRGYLTDVITDDAVRWMEERKSDKPFCLLVHHKAPHAPYDYPDKFASFYEEDLPEPETLDDNYATRKALQNSTTEHSRLDMVTKKRCKSWKFDEIDGPERLSGVPLRKWVYQRLYKRYLRLVAALDENVGRLIDFVDSTDLKDNTIVVYTSDNGFFLGDHGLHNKVWMYEESQRVPLLVRYPQEISAGTVNSDLVTTLDFSATFLDYAGIPLPEDMHGRSLRKLLTGKTPADWRDAVYYHYYGSAFGYGLEPQLGVRTKDEKLVYFYDFSPESYFEYFDLQKDPLEMRNAYDDPGYSERVKALKQTLKEAQKKFGEDKNCAEKYGVS